MRDPFKIIESLGSPGVKGILQVGANTGQELEYFASHGIQYAALIEPLPGPFAYLHARCSAYPGYLPIQTLCGSIDDAKVDFYISSNNGESSSIFKPAKHLNDFPWVSFPEKIELTSYTLDRILMALRTKSPEIAAALDFLYIDVQGGELEVMKGGNQALHQIRYIYTEVGLGGGYDGGVAFSDLMLYLKFYGFNLYECEIEANGWGNAFFAKL